MSTLQRTSKVIQPLQGRTIGPGQAVAMARIPPAQVTEKCGNLLWPGRPWDTPSDRQCIEPAPVRSPTPPQLEDDAPTRRRSRTRTKSRRPWQPPPDQGVRPSSNTPSSPSSITSCSVLRAMSLGSSSLRQTGGLVPIRSRRTRRARVLGSGSCNRGCGRCRNDAVSASARSRSTDCSKLRIWSGLAVPR